AWRMATSGVGGWSGPLSRYGSRPRRALSRERRSGPARLLQFFPVLSSVRSSDRDLCFTPATALARLYRTHKVSPLEVMGAVLGPIDALTPALGAYVTVARDQALDAARRATAALRRRATLPSLHGIPVSIKDVTPTRGMRTTWGSRLHEHHVPAEDALIVER